MKTSSVQDASFAGVRVRVIEHAGYRIRVVSSGPRNGPAAIVLPGMGGDPYVLAPQLRLLRALGYATHMVQLPGFGLGPPLRREDAHFRQLAEYVAAATRAIGVERALLLGHSLGGGLALYVALQDPDLVERLVLIAPAAVGRSLGWMYRLLALPMLGRALLRPAERGSLVFLRHFAVGRLRRDDRRFIDALARRERRSATAALTARAIVWANEPQGWCRLSCLVVPGDEQSGFTLARRLAELRGVPMLVLWGSDDAVISARDAARIRVANPAAEIHVARSVGHLLPLEAPAWCCAHIARFVARSQVPASVAA